MANNVTTHLAHISDSKIDIYSMNIMGFKCKRKNISKNTGEREKTQRNQQKSRTANASFVTCY